MANNRVKQSNIWDSGLLLDVFDLVVVNVILGSLAALAIYRKKSIFKMLILPHL